MAKENISYWFEISFEDENHKPFGKPKQKKAKGDFSQQWSQFNEFKNQKLSDLNVATTINVIFNSIDNNEIVIQNQSMFEGKC